MNLQIEYTTGAGAAAVYVRQRNFSGKYGNFVTQAWDTTESANTKVFFTEPDAVNATGFFATPDFTPITGGPWPLDIVRASDGLIIGKADTDDAVNSILSGITADHGAGIYGPGVSAEFSIEVTTVLVGTSTPIPDVTVTLLNEDQSVVLSQKTSDSMGVTNFPANAGTYVLRHRKAGYSFDPDTAVVTTANVAHTCEGIPLIIPAIYAPGTQTLIISAKELGTPWAAGDKVAITPVGVQFSGDSVVSSKSKRATIGAGGIAGYWTDDLVPVWVDGVTVDIGLVVRVEISDYYISSKITITADPIRTLKAYFP